MNYNRVKFYHQSYLITLLIQKLVIKLTVVVYFYIFRTMETVKNTATCRHQYVLPVYTVKHDQIKVFSQFKCQDVFDINPAKKETPHSFKGPTT